MTIDAVRSFCRTLPHVTEDIKWGLARNMWVQEQELGDVLDRRELESLIKTSYDLVVAKLPRSKREPAGPKTAGRRPRAKPASRRPPRATAKTRARAKAAPRKPRR